MGVGWRTFVEHTPAAVAVFDRDMRYLAASRRYLTDYGLGEQQLIGRSHYDVFPELPEQWKAAHRRCLAGAVERSEEDSLLRADGRLDWVRWELTPWYERSGQIGGLFFFSEVITEAKALKETVRLQNHQLQDSEARFRATFEQAAVGLAHVAPDGRFLLVNQKLCDILGYSRKELLARTFQDITHPEDLDGDLSLVQKLLEGSLATYDLEKRYRRGDGREVWASLTVSLVRDVSGAPDYFISVVQDIGERKRVEQALHRKTEELERYFADTLDLLCIADTDGRFLRLNKAWTDTLGYALDELEGHRFLDFVHPDDVEATVGAVSRLVAREDVHAFVNRYRCSDGSYRWIEWRSRSAGRLIYAVARDITDRVKSEQALRRSEAMLNESQAIAHVGSFDLDLATGEVSWSAELYRLFGLAPAPGPMRLEAALAMLHPDDVAKTRQAIEDARDRERGADLELRVRRPDSQLRTLHATGQFRRGSDGAPRLVGSVLDITEKKLVEQQKQDLESQLRMAQKMEAIGRLAGGVAHDFNNLLSVILSYTQFARGQLRDRDPMREDLEEVLKAATSAASLTRQLLAFSRQQVLEPRVLELDELVVELGKMLGRLVGEHIALTLAPARRGALVRADPGQLEQVVLNLVVNARDAMPSGGKLTIATSEVELGAAAGTRMGGVAPGPYVVLEVKDTGAGMDAATVERIFEPFFTTKPKGKGTGLGLATVYGIVAQSGGGIDVESAPGEGTTFRVYLPRATGEPTPAAAPSRVQPEAGSETILLVEDEAAVRTMAARILQGAGYQVLSAAHGGEALLLCERREGAIDLLVTDVVMPQMSGKELADRLAKLRPALRVLYISGYTDDLVAQHGVLEPGTRLLAKPFSSLELLRKVRAALDS